MFSMLALVFGCMVVLLLLFWPAITTLPQQIKATVTVASIFFTSVPPVEIGIATLLRLKQSQVNILAAF
jgi:hypothetical protein